MKTYAELFDDIVSFDNLYNAAKKAQRGKRFHQDVAEFNLDLEKEILRLRRELIEGTYKPGRYKQFFVREKEIRLISAAPYRDRVVHHAVMNVLEPILSGSFIFDSYANRVGKGSHKAVKRFQKFLRSSQYVLKCDIKKYFHTIDHEILLYLIGRKIKDEKVLWLVHLIVETSPPQEKVIDYFHGDNLFTPIERRKGLPIGNLTSQFFANFYLDGFDHYVKEKLQCRRYLRYVDDFVVFGNDKDALWNIHDKIEEFLNKNLRVKLHLKKTRIFLTDEGITFLGYRVCPDRMRVERSNVVRFRRRYKRMQKEYKEWKMDLKEVNQRISGWLGHAKQANTLKLREQIFQSGVFQRGQARR